MMLGSKAPTMMPTDCSVLCTPTILPTYEQAHVDLDLLTLASYILYYVKCIEVNIKLSTQKTRPKDYSFRRASHSRLMFILYKICTFKTTYKKLFNILPIHLTWLCPRPISNSQLHVLPHFHLCPIYLVVFKGSYNFRWDISS